MSWVDFKRRYPQQAIKIEADEARRKGVALPLPSTKKWSSATPTEVRWSDGRVVTLPSKTEARVAQRLLAEYPAEQGYTVYRKVRFPLFSIEPEMGGIPHYLEIDFVVTKDCEIVKTVDAKTKRKSRDWARGKAAGDRVLKKLGVRIEETSD